MSPALLKGLGAANTPNYSIDDIVKYTNKPAGSPSGFRRVLGGIVGGAANLVAPGLGSTIGGLISGNTLNSTGLMGDATQFLELQRNMNMETRAFETASTMMKARHDCMMSSIRNMK